MISTDHTGNQVAITVFGEFTLADYREFEELVNYKIKFEGPVDLFFDLTKMGRLHARRGLGGDQVLAPACARFPPYRSADRGPVADLERLGLAALRRCRGACLRR